ncbi:acylphosphatase [Anaeramoeba ignava]|uniref:acylphosphatase n=1 Tax=Anaeramoeba ignava TaxID=1746090 RepID=A0A9Q0LKA7_ANAIG|nr:acylphosphatase [Anaeramoeba ignava]
MTSVIRYFIISGNVQGVFFRQTIVNAAINRGLKAGATNLFDGTVSLTLSGEDSKVQELIDYLKSGKEINSWNAQATDVEEKNDGKSLEKHQVSTEKKDSVFKPRIEIYI